MLAFLRKFYKEYEIIALREKNLDVLFEFCAKNAFYYEISNEILSKEKLQKDLKALPQGARFEDKFYLGFFKETKLCVVLEFILHYPDENTAMLGFFMLAKELQGQNHGSEFLQNFFQILQQKGFQECVLSFHKDNLQARNFWLKNGFLIEANEEEFEDLVSMEKKLG
ncbi:GNAT family N-acetyltransferase [Campylobacter sp. VTCC 70190]|uniref:GNAT family N-acetyltransferase n=1 Tax=Campylobacter sp. VTCC 70190 TaxID=3392118 RepID=UPI00398EC093